MLELVWQKTEIILVILVAVGMLAMVLGSIVLAVVWVCDVLKVDTRTVPMKPSQPVRPPTKYSTVVPTMHKRGHAPREHKPGYRRAARMNYNEVDTNPCASILDSTCPGGCD